MTYLDVPALVTETAGEKEKVLLLAVHVSSVHTHTFTFQANPVTSKFNSNQLIPLHVLIPILSCSCLTN